jgi:hypothetical protein
MAYFQQRFMPTSCDCLDHYITMKRAMVLTFGEPMGSEALRPVSYSDL